jgi:hypothetical protein
LSRLTMKIATELTTRVQMGMRRDILRSFVSRH